MKTIGLLAGIAGALLASVGCGGTVVFEEDGGEGGQGAGSSQNGPTTSVANGGGNPVSSTAIGTTGPTTVGPGPGPSTSTGPAGCGSFLDGFGLGAGCIDCLNGSCCDQLLACDVGTECYGCAYGISECTPAANAALEAFAGCYPSCEDICNGNPCGEDAFQCFDGTCISFEFVCDGFPDCFEGEDEFCEDNGICGTGVTVFDPQADQCLGDFCCDAFQECADFGGVDGCQQCLENGGGDVCNGAIECAIESPCFGEGNFEICGGLSVDDPQLAECLNENCCEQLDQCASGPNGSEGCAECFEDGGPLCDPVIECYFQNCDEEFEDGDGPPPDDAD